MVARQTCIKLVLCLEILHPSYDRVLRFHDFNNKRTIRIMLLPARWRILAKPHTPSDLLKFWPLSMPRTARKVDQDHTFSARHKPSKVVFGALAREWRLPGLKMQQ